MGFLGEVVATRAPEEEIHVILDNLSTHKTKPFRWKYANPARRITHGELSSRTVH